MHASGCGYCGLYETTNQKHIKTQTKIIYPCIYKTVMRAYSQSDNTRDNASFEG